MVGKPQQNKALGDKGVLTVATCNGACT